MIGGRRRRKSIRVIAVNPLDYLAAALKRILSQWSTTSLHPRLSGKKSKVLWIRNTRVLPRQHAGVESPEKRVDSAAEMR